MASGGASFCSCDPCLTANGIQPNPVDRATFFRHNPRRSRRRLPPRSGARAPPVAASQTSPSRRTDHGPPSTPSDEEATPDDGELSDDSAGSSSSGSFLGTDPSTDPAAGLSVLAALQSLVMLGIKGVRVSLEHFLWAIDDFFAFIFSVEYTLPREGVASLLKQRGSWRHFLTPFRIAAHVKSSVHLAALPVSCRPRGCMSFSIRDDTTTACPHCGAKRYKRPSVPARVMPYWPLTPWLRMMLEDPVLSRAMRDYMAYARQCAAEPVSVYRDWFDGATFRKLCRDKVIISDGNIVLSVLLDGFDSWRQSGCNGCPVLITILSLPPSMRSKILCMLPVRVTPGPREPVNLDSFLELLMEELKTLAAGVVGVNVHGMEDTFTLRAFCLQVTTDMQAGHKITHMTGQGGYTPIRNLLFNGVRGGKTYYYPPIHPTMGDQLFSLTFPEGDLRTSDGVQADADAVESMRAAGRPATHVAALVRLTGVTGYSPLLSPGPTTRAALPSLSYLWELGPAAAAPYDPMHLLFCNVLPNLWTILCGKLEAEKGVTEELVLPASLRKLMGEEYATAARTVPARQARAMRDIDRRSGSFKAVDWLFFLLCGGGALLYGRVPITFYEMFMCLCRAERLLVRPSPVSVRDLDKAEEEIKAFLEAFYRNVYRGELKRVRLCRLVFAALLDLVPNVRQCGPVWSFWQFPMERFIETLPKLIGSRSHPHQSLVNSITERHQSELIAAYAARMCPGQWAAATGESNGAGDDCCEDHDVSAC